MNKNKLALAVGAAVASLAISSAAVAGGLAVTAQNAVDVGSALSGNPNSASSMYANPANLYSLDGDQLSVGANLVSPDVTVTNAGTVGPSAAFGLPISGDATAEPTDTAIIPNFYYRRQLPGRDLVLGLGVNVPYGVTTEYDDDSFARYEATESSLRVLNVNPAVAWQANEKVTLGVGLNVQHASATLSKQVDAYLVCGATAQALGAAAAQAAAAGGALPAAQQQLQAALGDCSTYGGPGVAANDGSADITTEGWAFGFNAGAIYKLNEQTKISGSFRSKVSHETEGDADFTIADPVLSTVLNDQNADIALELPATASIGISHQLNDKTTLAADATWTQWSSIPEIRVTFDGGQADSVTDLQWDDTVRYGASVTHVYDDKTTLRAGVGFDPTPTPSAKNRTPRAPSADTTWFSVGATRQIKDNLSVDVGVAYLQINDAAINYTAPGTADYTTRGDVESSAIVGGVSVNYKF